MHALVHVHGYVKVAKKLYRRRNSANPHSKANGAVERGLHGEGNMFERKKKGCRFYYAGVDSDDNNNTNNNNNSNNNSLRQLLLQAYSNTSIVYKEGEGEKWRSGVQLKGKRVLVGRGVYI